MVLPKTYHYNLLMAIRRAKEKNQDPLLNQEKSQPYNIYLRPNIQDTGQIASTHDFRSHSKGKHKLKLHIFKNRSPMPDTPKSPSSKDLLQSYSSVASLHKGHQQSKPNVREYLASKNALLTTAKEPVEKEKPSQHSKMKRQYKLIHQIKRERHIQAQQKIKKVNKQIESDTKIGPDIQAGSHEKIGVFAEEMRLILSPTTEEKEVSNFPQDWINKPEEPIFLKQETKTVHREPTKFQIPEQSLVRMSIPLGLLQSQESPQLPPKNPPQQEQVKSPDFNRSFSIAEMKLKKRKDSSSSIEVSFRESKVRAEISISLALQSRQASKIDLSAFYKQIQGKKIQKDAISTRDKVYAHIQILSSLSSFVYQSIKFDQMGEQWQQLNFLIYKKFYLERKKTLNFLMKYPMKNPFFIYNAEINSRQIIQYMKTQEGAILLADLKKETQNIKDKLASIYSQFDNSKVGEKINLYEYDNFSYWVIQQLWAELILTQHNTSHTKQEINIRLCRILQVIFLISEINGKYECSFEEAETAIADQQYRSYIKEGKEIFQRYIMNQGKKQSSDEGQGEDY